MRISADRTDWKLKRRFGYPTIAHGMMILGLDTSEALGGAALYDERGVEVERMMRKPLRHAEVLLPLVDALLIEQGVSREDIDKVSVNRGPGSFTGLRIGLATAKGLCQGLGIPLVGVDGTMVYRLRAREVHRVCVILESRRDLLYVRWFAGDRAKGPTAVWKESRLGEQLATEDRPLLLVGNGAPRFAERFADHPYVRIAPLDLCQASPLAIARAGEGQRTDCLFEIEAIYVESSLTDWS